ncbi:2-dehydro-3-deoxy-6-phosphogalactonate aldolase [Pluralibacter gergoviae]|uniref:2-dehydro-3-deoxy-6-phosphogalactonate aldolase n=1 Tax=Pluralibacter gergoviae TaxID=61647 RepID=UPI0005EC0AC6|nr:2-dehydro-3-deoxy-6-phosphogalactonate aldolase [Pluralibacter gergoviae]KJM59652.1 2-dehydro-3-deoxy-6-phosphogalactonate aldolase [Pluralibacter gergoviae]OUR04033.1 2-dehydro-3-deoxy-6-phosphogalactonate aldolase [Pluralibacter gergoviae]
MKNSLPLPLIAILRGIRPADIDGHLQALTLAGFTLIEIPLNSPGWEQSIALAVELFGDRAKIGAGTVLTVAQVNRLAALGCQLIVTPNTAPPVIRRALALGMTVYAGCATATEAFQAIDAGATRLKIFPSSTFGPEYISALGAVMPAGVALYAVGGVTPENLDSYLRAGCAGVGLGGALYQAGQTVEETAKRAAAFANRCRELLKN